MTKVTPMPKSGGFTLVEAIISLFFVAFIVSQLAMISIHGAHTSTLARRVTKANMLADEALEKTRNRAFPNIQDPINDLGEASCDADTDLTIVMVDNLPRVQEIVATDVTTCPPLSPLPPVIDRIYRRYRMVRPVDNTGAVAPLVNCSKAQVDVIVDFTDVQGNPRQVRVSSVVSRF